MIKRVLINARFLNQSVTGVQRYARGIVNVLGNFKGNRYHFSLYAHRGPLFDPPKELDVLQDHSLLKGHLWEQIRLPYHARKLRADILWSPCNIGPVFAKNHLVTIHDASVFAGPEWFSRRFRMLYQFSLPLLGRSAERVITDTHFSKMELVKYGITEEERIRIVAGGVDSNFFLANTLRKTKFEFPYVFAIGAGDPRKNISLLLKAWGRISMEIKKGIKLVISGKGGKSFSGRTVGSIPEDVKFIGYVQDEELPGLYAGAIAFFYPSFYEGFGLPPLEAMASGTPVLVSRIGALLETCGDAALYCDASSEKDISEKITQMLTNERMRKELTQKGRERVMQFHWETAASELLKIFDEIV